MPRWRPDTPGRALLLGVAIALGLELVRLLAALAVGAPHVLRPDFSLLVPSNLRISLIVSSLTGFATAWTTYAWYAGIRDLETRRLELGWSQAQLDAVTAGRGARPRSALLAALALAPVGMLLVTSSDPSLPFLWSEDPWTFGIIAGLAANVTLFGVIGATAHVTWTSYRTERALEEFAARPDLLDTTPDRRIAAAGLRRSFFWLGASSLASLVFVDLGFSWMTGLVLSLTLAFGALLFMAPLARLARRIGAEKERELARVRARIRDARDALLDDKGSAALARASELPALLAYEQRIESVREWAIDVSQILRFATLVVLALGSWLGGAVTDRIVDAWLR